MVIVFLQYKPHTRDTICYYAHACMYLWCFCTHDIILLLYWYLQYWLLCIQWSGHVRMHEYILFDFVPRTSEGHTPAPPVNPHYIDASDAIPHLAPVYIHSFCPSTLPPPNLMIVLHMHCTKCHSLVYYTIYYSSCIRSALHAQLLSEGPPCMNDTIACAVCMWWPCTTGANTEFAYTISGSYSYVYRIYRITTSAEAAVHGSKSCT